MLSEDIELLLNAFHEQQWEKPQEVLETYLNKQNTHQASVFVAEWQGEIAGYTVLYPHASHGPFTDKGIPEISDFNVLKKYQRKGIGNKILDAAEQSAAKTSPAVCLGVGLHAGYGTAQRMYIKRGYIPDGSGVWYKDVPLPPYADCRNDDDLILYFSKQLSSAD